MLNHRKLGYLLPWIIVVLMMLLIFNLSAQPAQNSDHLSLGVTERVIELLNQIFPSTEWNLDYLNHVVRKNAHFFIYLVLSILVQIAVKRSKIIGFKRILFVLGICVLYASSDEIHQLFVSGRGAQVKDVFIDSAGALLGIVIYWTGTKRSSLHSAKV
ncbi:VanZ family protein [Neobacillus drentensis]